MQRKFDKFYKTSMLVMVAIIIWLLWRCCGGLGSSAVIGSTGSDTSRNVIVYIPMYEPFVEPDAIPLNQPRPCTQQDNDRFIERGGVGELPCNQLPGGPDLFKGGPDPRVQSPGVTGYDRYGTPIYTWPNDVYAYNPGDTLNPNTTPREPVAVSAPATLYLFIGAIATIIALRRFKK